MRLIDDYNMAIEAVQLGHKMKTQHYMPFRRVLIDIWCTSDGLRGWLMATPKGRDVLSYLRPGSMEIMASDFREQICRGSASPEVCEDLLRILKANVAELESPF